MVFLDTNICIYLINSRSPALVETFRKHAERRIVISAITLAELQYGVQASSAVQRNADALSLFLTPLEVAPFSSGAAEAYGVVRARLKREGNLIGTNDLLIAAHALSEKAVLVTNNEREFCRVKGLRVENWVREG